MPYIEESTLYKNQQGLTGAALQARRAILVPDALELHVLPEPASGADVSATDDVYELWRRQQRSGFHDRRSASRRQQLVMVYDSSARPRLARRIAPD